MNEQIVKYLKDYEKSAFIINHTDLYFSISDHYTTQVSAKLSMEKVLNNKNLILFGVDLELEKIAIDGIDLKASDYRIEDESLEILKNLPQKFLLTTVINIKPHKNTSLEGLYQSGKNFFTQCEPEGFRKITYYLDRPDVMSTFDVTVEAPKASFPVLLSNGNFVEKKDLPHSRHSIKWSDPFKKPSYLFALVAGDFASIKDSFVTTSGRKVALEIYSEKENIENCYFAMESLKKSMKWDEDRFGLECDLDSYKVVAVGDFNMGAMENKGLNIFNIALVLANPQTTTDATYARIESVMGHEYFHNWTGNRVTCRDWFQLCLKEGLTVFRDQEFSSDMGSAGVCRIQEVQALKSTQFLEDSGPLVHPPRPDKYIEMNNFYTATVYNKGAECVRMIQTLIGKEAFRKGMDLYFKRFDGMAVTQEDFVQAMADASNKNLTQFFTWYTQSGTPQVKVETTYNESTKILTIVMEQKVLPTADGQVKKSLHIPMRLGMLNKKGDALLWNGKTDGVIELTKDKQVFSLSGILEKPVLSLFRDFSAPVVVEFAQSDEELLCLASYDTDPYNAFDSWQKLATKEILRLVDTHSANSALSISPVFFEGFENLLENKQHDHALKALALALPETSILVQSMKIINVEALSAVLEFLKKSIASKFENHFLKIFKTLESTKAFVFEKEEISKRRLRTLCISYLGASDNKEVRDLIQKTYEKSSNMTESFACLRAIIFNNHTSSNGALESFYNRFKDQATVCDMWFQVQALSPQSSVSEKVRELLNHEKFTLKNPNRLRSLLTAFCTGNLLQFHNKEYNNYEWCAQKVIELNAINPQMAASLTRSLIQFNRFDASRKQKMITALKLISSTENLSKDVYEIVYRALN